MILLLFISFVIDDGTGATYVSCTNQQVAALLCLDAAQWAALEAMAEQVGQLTFQSVCYFYYVTYRCMLGI